MRFLVLLVVFTLVQIVNGGNATDASASKRVSFFNAFADEGTIESTFSSQHPAMAESDNDLIIVTSPSGESASGNSTASSAADLSDLTVTYTLAGSNRLGFKSNTWRVVRDGTINGSVWTRLQAQHSNKTDVCAIVIPVSSLSTAVLLQLVDRVNSFCAPQDFVLLGFTAPVEHTHAQYLTAAETINGQYTPRPMQEVVNYSYVSRHTQFNASSARNRLFIAMPGPNCLEQGVAATVDGGNTTDISVAVCFGSGCNRCANSSSPANGGSGSGDNAGTAQTHSSSKRGLIVVICCGSFLIGCALVFFVFFRKEFFTPSESTKAEKDLTTNLAYVLRM